MIAAASVERPQVRKVRVIAAEQTKGFRRGKSGLRRAGCRITSGGGDSKASATEIYRQCLTLSVELIGKGGKAV